MKKIIIVLITLSSFVLPSFAKNNQVQVKRKNSILIQSYVREYSKRIDEDIKEYNRVKRDPSSFLKDLNKQDKKEFINLLKYYKVKELPEIKKNDNNYSIEGTKHTITFNYVDFFNNQIKINNKIYSLKNRSIKEEHEHLRNFLMKKSGFNFINFIIDQANANGTLLTDEINAMGVLIIAILHARVQADNELRTQLMRVNREIVNLKTKCEEELPLAGKPDEVKETLSVLSFFSQNNKIMKDELADHLYSNLIGENKEYGELADKDPISCKEFVKLINSTRNIDVADDKLEEQSKKICNNHQALQQCLVKFHNEFIQLNDSRSIEKVIEGYTPENEFIRKSLNK